MRRLLVVVLLVMSSAALVAVPAGAKTLPSCLTSKTSKCRPPTAAEIAKDPGRSLIVLACGTIKLEAERATAGEPLDQNILGDAIATLAGEYWNGPIAPKKLITDAKRAPIGAAQIAAVSALYSWCRSRGLR